MGLENAQTRPVDAKMNMCKLPNIALIDQEHCGGCVELLMPSLVQSRGVIESNLHGRHDDFVDFRCVFCSHCVLLQ